MFDNLTVQDWASLALNAFMCVKAELYAHGPGAAAARHQAFGLFAIVVILMLLVRGELLPAGPVRASLYRVGMFVTLISSYLILRAILPALSPELLDARLLSMDRALFGETPSLALDRFVTRGSVEWFAFFYFSYYVLFAGYVVGTLFLDSGRRRYELCLGIVLIAVFGHSGYTFVPGVGPWAYDQLHFQHELVGGAWWGRTMGAVKDAGAMLDIFPSLHTAFSLMIGLHVWRHRRDPLFSFLWLPTCFAVLNVIIATVFLRWHYGVDLLAGAALAVVAQRVAIFAWRWEGVRDSRHGLQAPWEAVLPAELEGPDRTLIMALFFMELGAIACLLHFA